jgi:hypothetical protein
MWSCSFAQPKLLSSHLAGRTLALCLDDLPRKLALQVKRAPWTIGWHVVRLELEQEHIRHDGHRPRALDSISLFGDLMLP